MKVRIEAEGTGEHFCDLDLDDVDVTKLITYAMSKLETDKNTKIQYSSPLKEEEITNLIQYALCGLLAEENKKKK
jgi:hypothetical protein